uniref:Uncharacterized protein n=1 Tax=Rhizophora mucronata TaxID=61149 RepID=A0A2P2N9H5_RHIMU
MLTEIKHYCSCMILLDIGAQVQYITVDVMLSNLRATSWGQNVF